MSKFQKGDPVIVVETESTDRNWQKQPVDLVGKVGVIDQVFEYPASNFIPDYIVVFENGDEIAVEENYLNYNAVEEVAVELPVDLLAKVPVPRVNYLYVVEDEDGVYLKTFDRDHAREEKASYGGKKAGVIITAYAAVKEIR